MLLPETLKPTHILSFIFPFNHFPKFNPSINAMKPSIGEALLAKSIAEEKFNQASVKSALKFARKSQKLCPELDGISQLVLALKVHVAAQACIDGEPDWYNILQLEPFSHLNSIKKQYRKLALFLHPDKNSCVGSEEAFKWVGKAWGVLSDRLRKKIYDLKRRMALESASTHRSSKGERRKKVSSFWTACSTCRLFHEFERRYVGHRLMCPSCKKSFLAVEVDSVVVNGSSNGKQELKDSFDNAVGGKLGYVNGGSKSDTTRVMGCSSDIRRPRSKRIPIVEESPSSNLGSPKHAGLKRTEKSAHKKVKISHKAKKSRREKTLSEIQLEAKCNTGKTKTKEHTMVHQSSDPFSMPVEDSDFYDFDKDRDEWSFGKGQVWAIYDDDDGMPRHYGLIDDTESVNPFKLQMIWLDIQNNGDEALVCWEKSGFHISSGTFKVGRKITIDSVNVFSHIMRCERVAREIYRIYPLKGSIWALYSEGICVGDERNLSDATRLYDVVLLLTSYTEMYGLSMAYLEKVDGFKTIFRRKEIGCHAVKWMEKDEFRLFSHQVPARKLLGTEAPGLPNDCWELDPAALPYDLLKS